MTKMHLFFLSGVKIFLQHMHNYASYECFLLGRDFAVTLYNSFILSKNSMLSNEMDSTEFKWNDKGRETACLPSFIYK